MTTEVKIDYRSKLYIDGNFIDYVELPKSQHKFLEKIIKASVNFALDKRLREIRDLLGVVDHVD